MNKEENLKSKTFSGLIFKTLERVGTQGVSLVISIVLARLLTPEDYGNVTLLLVFVSLLDVIINYGLGAALIQKKNPDKLDFSTCLYASLIITVIIYILLFFGAPFISQFFDKPVLTLMLRIIGIRVIFAGISSIQYAYIAKNFLFKKTFWATILSTVLSGAIGIIMAYKGAKEWALIMQSLSSSVISVLALAVSIRMGIVAKFSFSRLKKVFSLGSRLLAIGILNSVYGEIRSIIIGKKYTTSDLAYYDKGRNFPKLVSNNINAIIDGVLFSTLSSVQDDKEQIVSVLSRSIRTSMYLLCPMLIGLALTSDNLILVLYTEKWMEAALYLKIFSISFLTMPVITLSLNAIKSVGKGNLALGINITTIILSLILLCVSMFFGVIWIAMSTILSNVLQTMIYMYYSKKLFDYKYSLQVRDIFVDLPPTLLMGAVVFGVGFLPMAPILRLLSQIATGVVAFVVVSIVTKNRSFAYLKLTIKSKVKKQ